MAENPPLNRLYVLGYAANDKDYPLVSMNLDPRVAGYKVPEDLSICPDKRYPNHVFTGAQPLSGDERVRHVWEILPSPWVPFTRYDDDLGPIQGRKRSVANTGQEASLTSDKKISYEGREGSAIVSTELEETWSIKTDEDGNSLFPIKDRDFYDASRGPVQERRQLFVPTGEEEGSLENVNGVITQTSYEPYNEFLSVKIVQTYKVDGPQLIGKTTDNDGQLVTVTTQRKGALNYAPPNPTATRTVEVSREDAESLVERIIDTPEIFKANTFSVERPDPIPQKFRVAVPIQSSQEIVEGTAITPTLEEGEISKSEEQRNKFIKRVSSTSRDQTVLPQTLTGKTTNNERQEVTVTETLQLGNTTEAPTATTTIESEALGDGNYVITKTQVDEVFPAITFSKERPDPVPVKFRAAIPSLTRQENLEGKAEEPVLVAGEIVKSEQQVNQFVKRMSTTARNATQLPKSLTQKLTTNEGLLATVTETLQNGDTSEVPTSKKTVESEALGDGTYVVRITESPKVFSAKTFRAEKADMTPQKFRAKQSDLTTEENIEGTAEQPTLGENQFLKSEQQINEFVKRVVTNTRITELNETLNEFVITPEGQLATRDITLSKSKQTLTPSAKVINGNIEELGDGRTVKTEIKVSEVFDGKQESLEKPEVIPPEFRASLQNKTVSEIKAGISSTIISLSQDELSKTIQRLTEHKIRETKVTRPTSAYPQLTGELIDNDLIKVARTRTVSKDIQTISPSARVSGTVEALGDGYTLKTEDTKDKIFDAKQKTLTQAVQIPAKFLNGRITETEFIEEATNEEPEDIGDDGFGIVQSSSQMVNAFLRRQTKREQEGVIELTEQQTNNFNQKVTVTSSIVDNPEIAPTEFTAKTEFIKTQAIGGGKYVKEIGRIKEIWDSHTKSAQKPDVIPEQFRASVPTITEQEIVEKNKLDEELDLEEGDIEKSQQRVTEFTVRETKVTRDIDSFPTLSGQEYDASVDIVIPFTEEVTNSGESLGDENKFVDPLSSDFDLVRTIDKDAIKQQLESILLEFPSRANLSLPPVLRAVRVIWDTSESNGSYDSEYMGTSSGQSWSLSGDEDANALSSGEVIPSFEVDIDDTWANNIPTTSYFFFLKYPVKLQDILRKVDAKQWPIFKPKSHTISALRQKKELRLDVSASTSTSGSSTTNSKSKKEGWGDKISTDNATVSLTLQPTLHSDIGIDSVGSYTIPLSAKASVALRPSHGFNAVINQTGETTVVGRPPRGTLPSTSPPDIPRNGKYLIDSRVELYQYGYAKVYAEVLDASIFAG